MEPLNVQSALSVLEVAASSANTTDCADLVGQLERIKALAWARILADRKPVVDVSQRKDELLTIQQVAERLKMSPYRAYELARQGKLKAVKIGKLVRVTPEAIREFVGKMNGGKAA